jgi:hypothetical protein
MAVPDGEQGRSPPQANRTGWLSVRIVDTVKYGSSPVVGGGTDPCDTRRIAALRTEELL